MYSKFVIRAASSMALCLAITSAVQAETLGERAIYTVNVLHAGHADQVGQCSAFTFGDVSDGTTDGTGCLGGLSDNTVVCTAPFVGRTNECGLLFGAFYQFGPYLVDGDGVAADGLAGTMTIETAVADGAGDNTFSITAFQMDPYLATAGGTFKTSMNPANIGAAMTGTGTVDALGNMTLDPTGRVGAAQGYEDPDLSLGIQPWNIDDSVTLGVAGSPTGLYEPFTTGVSTNYLPADGTTLMTLTGRAVGDANADSILDAVLVAAGNVGTAWGFFDGVAYSESLNVQFVLVSAKPVAKEDVFGIQATDTLTINIANDLLANDLHADAAEIITFDSFSATTGSNSTLVDIGGGELLYTPPSPIGELSDTFTYTIVDGTGAASSHTATVTINLAQNAAPTANGRTTAADEDVATTIDPTINDTDPDLDALSIVTFDATSNAGGTVIAATGNNVIYTSPANYSGADFFNYTITDGQGNNASAVVNITVNAVNDPLVCANVDLVTDTDLALDIDVAATLVSTCSDIDTVDTPAYSSVQTPTDQGGTVSYDGSNTLTYTPASGFTGTDTFTYTASDGTVDEVKTITVTVGVTYDNFTMLQAAGLTFGGTNDVQMVWDQTLHTSEGDTASNLTVETVGPTPFNGFVWVAHDARVFGPGTYSFDSGCTVAEVQATGCPAGSAANSGPTLSMTVGADQIGMHVLFDWSTSSNIDVVNVYDLNAAWDDFGDVSPKNALWLGEAGASPDPATTWEWVSRDVDGDGIVGALMVDGPFVGYSANFNKGPGSSGTSEQLPYTDTASDTKLGSGALGLTVLFANMLVLISLRFFARRGSHGQTVS